MLSRKRERLKQDDIALVKAGKGETLILIERSTYIQKIYDFLEISKAVELKEFSINTFNSKIRLAISSSAYVIPSTQKISLYVMCYSTPCLYGQLKTHKSDMPVRPVVTCYTSPTFLLSRFLVNWFQRLLISSPPTLSRIPPS